MLRWHFEQLPSESVFITSEQNGHFSTNDISTDSKALKAVVRVDLRKVANGIFYVLGTGCQWNAVPREFGAGNTLHRWEKKSENYLAMLQFSFAYTTLRVAGVPR